MTWKKHIQNLMSQRAYAEAELALSEVVPSPEDIIPFDAYTEVLNLALKKESKIGMDGLLQRYPDMYYPKMVYAKYLIGIGEVDKSIAYYQAALVVCTELEDRIDMLRELVFMMVYLGNVNEAFLYARDLVQASAYRCDMRMLFWICSLAAPSTTNEEIRVEANRILQKLGVAFSIPEISTTQKQYGDIKIDSAPGLEEFLTINGLAKPDHKSVTEIGVCSELTTIHDADLEAGKFLETLGGPKHVEAKVAELRKSEDVVLLYRIANAMYTQEYYGCARIFFRALIEIFINIDQLRLRFLKLSFNCESNEFFRVAKLTMSSFSMFKESVKRFNMSVYLTGKGKGKHLPELEEILILAFPDLDLINLYQVPPHMDKSPKSPKLSSLTLG
ncbi:hypothetical protein NEHOM01_0518 [Nematocida homosporus]|uniref:uncharacterized protein n=1 Tax=Nematocida homosporus TaxID=1912981 RepID=UPI002220CF34|nr:uncharacterized protein NEHOM01_0518 [Nematocida homosporus]KAI5184967.1 hypothetical protein NEHOM01_0518 [Nematocida homosporus]